MRLYAYGFAWVDKDGIARKTFIEAKSRQEASVTFEEITGLDLILAHVAMNRINY